MSFAPVVVCRTLDRYTDLVVAGKNGNNLTDQPLVYGEPPHHLSPETVKIPGMTISLSAFVTTGLFTDDLEASCGFTKGWEGQADHWVIFEEKTFAPGERVSRVCYLSISEPPSPDHPGAEEVYARAAEVLGK